MVRKSIAAGERPTISLKIDGNLMVKGWDETEVLIECPSKEEILAEKVDERITIAGNCNCNVHVPLGATVSVEELSGNAFIKQIEGPLTIESINGNLNLRGVGTTSIATLRGNLTVRNLSGNLSVTTIHGHASLRDVQGDFIVAEIIGGNLKIKDINGNSSATARGNIIVHLDPAPGNITNFETGGNLCCYLPADASAQVDIPRAAKIMVRLPDVDIPSFPSAPFSLSLGDGDGKLTLSAQGNVILGEESTDWDIGDLELDISEDIDELSETIQEQIMDQIEAQLDLLESRLEAHLENIADSVEMSGIPPERVEKIIEKARLASQQATLRAQEKMQRAQEKMKHKLEAARRRAERKARATERAARDRRKRPEYYQWSPPKPEPSGEPVTDEERMMILKMLEQGKITLEEAEQLLAALEGNPMRGQDDK